MPKRPADFDWRTSPAHLDLLSRFVRPRDIAPVMDWMYLKDTIKEDTRDAFDRFIRDGALIPCDLDESLNQACTAAQLKKMLKERGLKQTGSKAELVERLIDEDRLGMEKVVDRLMLMKCSPDAITLLERYEELVQQEEDLARQRSHVALLDYDPKKAFKIYASHMRKYHPESSGPDWSASIMPKLQAILASNPKVLGIVAPSTLRSLQAAACMTELWQDDALDWLPDEFTTRLSSTEVAVNYLKRHAEFQQSIMAQGEHVKRWRIVFDPSDVDSCDLCLALDGREFDKDTLPDLPFEGCTSETGCMCRLESVFDWETDSDEEDYGEVTESDLDIVLVTPIAILKQLKEMLDNELITQADYDKKKAEILSRM